MFNVINFLNRNFTVIGSFFFCYSAFSFIIEYRKIYLCEIDKMCVAIDISLCLMSAVTACVSLIGLYCYKLLNIESESTRNNLHRLFHSHLQRRTLKSG